jgi:hypothetical protein
MFRNTKKRSLQNGKASGGVRKILLAESSDDEGNDNEDNGKDFVASNMRLKEQQYDNNGDNDSDAKIDNDHLKTDKQPSATKAKLKNLNHRGKKKVPKGNRVKLSFNAEEEEDMNDKDNDFNDINSASELKSDSRLNKHERSTSSKGFGFGGGNLTGLVDTEDDYDNNVKDVEAALTPSSSSNGYYDVDTLKRLVSEQKQQLPRRGSSPSSPTNDKTISIENITLNETVDVNNDYSRERHDKKIPFIGNDNSNADDYIPLDRTGNNEAAKFGKTTSMQFDEEESSIKQVEMILTGDDALSLHTKMSKRQSSDVTADSFETSINADNLVNGSMKLQNDDNEDDDQIMVDNDDDNDDWEAEVSRRAGVRVRQSNSNRLSSTLIDDRYESNSQKRFTNTSTSSLSEIRAAISKSIDDLESERNGLESIVLRRTHDIKQAQLEVEKQENELKQNGTALEFYQNWRGRMIAWVGAIREIQEKVKVILFSLHTLEADRVALDRWQDWENDIIAVLYQHKLLDRVLGRQPPDIIYHDVMTTIDEFGRDVKSQHVLQREQRRRKQQRILRNRTRKQFNKFEDMNEVVSMTEDTFGTQSDGFVSDDEEDTFRARHNALMKALALVIDGIDEEYTVLHNLFALFEEWYKVYPDEYNQCYANLSLADLASVLIQFELCSMNDPWDESGGYHEGRWMTSVRVACDNGIINDASIERIFERSVIPSIVEIFETKAFNIASRKQMKSFHTFIHRVEKVFPATAMKIISQLQPHMLLYLQEQLDTVAMPILIDIVSGDTQPTAIDRIWKRNDADSDELQDAIIGSTDVQFRRLNKILLNLLRYWAPHWQQHQKQEKISELSQDTYDFEKASSSFVECMIRFIIDKYLVLLSSIRSIQRHRQIQQVLEQQKQTPTGDPTLDALTGTSSTALLESFGSSETLFRELLDELAVTGWLADPKHSDLTASLRAAGAGL